MTKATKVWSVRFRMLKLSQANKLRSVILFISPKISGGCGSVDLDQTKGVKFYLNYITI